MSLLGWIAAGLTAAAVAAVVFSILCADEIRNWFQSRLSRNSFSSNRVGFTVMKHLNNGNFQVVQGVLNTATEEIVEGRTVEAEQIDSELRNAHDHRGFAIWN